MDRTLTPEQEQELLQKPAADLVARIKDLTERRFAIAERCESTRLSLVHAQEQGDALHRALQDAANEDLGRLGALVQLLPHLPERRDPYGWKDVQAAVAEFAAGAPIDEARERRIRESCEGRLQVLQVRVSAQQDLLDVITETVTPQDGADLGDAVLRVWNERDAFKHSAWRWRRVAGLFRAGLQTEPLGECWPAMEDAMDNHNKALDDDLTAGLPGERVLRMQAPDPSSLQTAAELRLYLSAHSENCAHCDACDRDACAIGQNVERTMLQLDENAWERPPLPEVPLAPPDVYDAIRVALSRLKTEPHNRSESGGLCLRCELDRILSPVYEGRPNAGAAAPSVTP